MPTTLSVQISDSGGTLVGSAKTALWPASTSSPVTLGASDDTWGAALTPDHINSGYIDLKATGASLGVPISVDSVLVQVYYTPAIGNPVTSSSEPMRAIGGMRGTSKVSFSPVQPL